MKKSIFVLLIIVLTSCAKEDKINHYSNKKVTELELIENGFFKYTNTLTTEDDPNDPDDDSFAGKTFTQVLYTNVKPQKQEDGKLYPVPIFKYDPNFSNEQLEERANYIKELDNRIISYFFINDTLTYKSIHVFSMNENKSNIVDFRTKEKIIKYYDSLKVSIKPIIEGKRSTEKHPTLFWINKFKTRIYYGERLDISYDLLTNYVGDEMPYWDITKQWYSGNTYEYEE